MTTHQTASRQDWLKARLALLEQEKAHTKRGDELASARQALPWVRIEADYRFDTEDGTRTLADLFRGRSQLLVYHFMFGPAYKAGCPSCSAVADGFNGFAEHLANHDVALWAVSRAPLPKLLAYRERMGWRFPWASSADTRFNFDFNTSHTEDQQIQGIEYNYRREPGLDENIVRPGAIPSRSTPDVSSGIAVMTGTDLPTYARERPGLSAFALEEGVVYHTYSTYARGLDAIWSAYPWLDRAPKGRNEHGYWWRRRDEYQQA